MRKDTAVIRKSWVTETCSVCLTDISAGTYCVFIPLFYDNEEECVICGQCVRDIKKDFDKI